MGMLPKDYKVPEVDGNYMRLKEGENQFRILTKPARGWEIWIEKQPKRYKEGEGLPIEEVEKADMNPYTGKPGEPRYFWAMVVWNRNAQPKPKLQILQVTQATIQKPIAKLDRGKAWGSSLGTDGYDILVDKDESGERTEYTVSPTPKEKLDPEILKEFKKAKINVEALFSGDDPFEKSEDKKKEKPVKEKEIPF